MTQNIKRLSVIILIGLLMLWSFLAGIERLLFLNANYYPDFLVNKTLSLDSKEQIYKLIDLTCFHRESDIIEKKNGIYVRCGTFWPKTNVTKVNLLRK